MTKPIQTIRIVLSAFRPLTLQLAILPVLLATLLGIRNGILVHPALFLVTINILITASLIQIISNLVNDLQDLAHDQKFLDPAREKALAKGQVSEKLIKIFLANIVMFCVISAIPLVVIGGWRILLIGITALVLAFLYTSKKYSLAQHYLAELAILIYFGPVATAGTYWLLGLRFSGLTILIGITSGLLGVALLTINNIRDYQSDIQAGRKNLVTLLGQTNARYLLTILCFVAPLFSYISYIKSHQIILALSAIAFGCLHLLYQKKLPADYKRIFLLVICQIFFINLLTILSGYAMFKY